MAFNGNSSDKPVVQESKLYTGITNMRVVAINPNKAQIEALNLGYRPQNEPIYVTKENGIDKVRLDIYLATKDKAVRTKVAFFLENAPKVNAAKTKGEWINNLGRTAWGGTEEAPKELKWFDEKTARRAKIGEADLYNFLINWLNINPNDEAKLDNFDMLFSGNVSELRALLQAYPENEVRVLLTVKEGKYQSVYSRYFDRATNKRTNYWESHIKNQAEAGYPIKEDFQNSLIFQEWIEPAKTIDTPSASTEAKKDDDDLPF